MISKGPFQPKLFYESKFLGLGYQRQLSPDRLPVFSLLERIYCYYLIQTTSHTWFLPLATQCAGLQTLRTQHNLCLGYVFPSKEPDCEPGAKETAIRVKSALQPCLWHGAGEQLGRSNVCHCYLLHQCHATTLPLPESTARVSSDCAVSRSHQILLLTLFAQTIPLLHFFTEFILMQPLSSSAKFWLFSKNCFFLLQLLNWSIQTA